jgi:ankyrin repeat protein
MQAKSLPSRPDLEQYKKQAKELLKRIRQGDAASLDRLKPSHPKYLAGTDAPRRFALADAQMVIAREHGHSTWADFAREIVQVNSHLLAQAKGAAHAFLVAASVSREGWHGSGNLAPANELLEQHPELAEESIYTAAVLGNAAAVDRFLKSEKSLATAEGGPYDWDALTYLCFSRYLRLEKTDSDGFVASAKALLDAGASANTGWWEENTGEDRAFWESAIYGASCVAQHAELTKLLLDHGANPNDEETPYHIPETNDLSVLKVVLDSAKMNAESLTTMLLRKADWHDHDGMRMLLVAGADPNGVTRWGNTALHQSIRRDNALPNIELLLDHGADFSVVTKNEGISGFALAARRGRGDILRLLSSRRIEPQLSGVDRLIASCALGDEASIHSLVTQDPKVLTELLSQGGKLLAEFAGTGNATGVKLLLDLGVGVNTHYEGDGYFDIAPESTALLVAAWKAWPAVVNLLIARGADVNAPDARGRTPLMMAVKACVDSHWQNRRSPEITKALLEAGASKAGVESPCGYQEVDTLLDVASESR